MSAGASGSSPAGVVQHDEAASRFFTQVDGELCVCEYRRQGTIVSFTHTEVPPSLAGRGIAAALVKTALDWAARQGLQVRPLCSYVAVYMRRHPETQALLAR